MSDFLPMGSEKLVVAAVGTISGALTFFFGIDTKPLIIWLAIFAAADLVTGMAAALIRHDYESKVAALGLLKKGLMFVVIGFAHGLDQQFAYTLDYLAVFQGIVIAAYGFNEVISIIENLDRMGLGGGHPADSPEGSEADQCQAGGCGRQHRRTTQRPTDKVRGI